MSARGSWFASSVRLYALVASDSQFAVDVYPTLDLAEQALAEVLADEPAFEELLLIASIEEVPDSNFSLN